MAPKLRDAATVLREMPFLRVAAVTGTAFFMLVAPVQHLMPAVVGEDAPAILVGVFIGAIGVGSVLANPIIGRQKTGSQQNQRLMQLGLLIATAGLVVLALGAQYGIVVGLLAAMLIGFGREFVYVGGVSTATVGVPFEMRGRSMGVLSVIVNGEMRARRNRPWLAGRSVGRDVDVAGGRWGGSDRVRISDVAARRRSDPTGDGAPGH